MYNLVLEVVTCVALVLESVHFYELDSTSVNCEQILPILICMYMLFRDQI